MCYQMSLLLSLLTYSLRSTLSLGPGQLPDLEKEDMRGQLSQPPSSPNLPGSNPNFLTCHHYRPLSSQLPFSATSHTVRLTTTHCPQSTPLPDPPTVCITSSLNRTRIRRVANVGLPRFKLHSLRSLCHWRQNRPLLHRGEAHEGRPLAEHAVIANDDGLQEHTAREQGGWEQIAGVLLYYP